MAWLHWTGAQYYTIPEFIREAREWGVSRRIKASILKSMSWGERIYLVGKERGLKRPVVFGFFYLERVKGIRLDEETRAKLEKETGKSIEVVSEDLSLLVKRGCGYCVEGGLYCATEASVEELVDYGDTEDPEIRGKLYILPKPYPALRNLSPFRGYRAFDEDSFRQDLSLQDGKGRPVLESLYYV